MALSSAQTTEVEDRNLVPFKVRLTNVRDNLGRRVMMGDMAYLDYETATKMHDLGVIEIPLEGLFNNGKSSTDEERTSDKPRGLPEGGDAEAAAKTSTDSTHKADDTGGSKKEGAGAKHKPKRRKFVSGTGSTL